jgi:hypothetical protein
VIDGERQDKHRNIRVLSYHEPKSVLVHGRVDVALLFQELDFLLAKLIKYS